MRTRTSITRSVSLDAELALWVERTAAGEHRSTSNYVNTLLFRLRDQAQATAVVTTVESQPGSILTTGEREPRPPAATLGPHAAL